LGSIQAEGVVPHGRGKEDKPSDGLITIFFGELTANLEEKRDRGAGKVGNVGEAEGRSGGPTGEEIMRKGSRVKSGA